jgi:hypothetical protein
MHTLFSIEDKYSFEIKKINDELCFTFKKIDTIPNYFRVWFDEYEKYQNGQIIKE